MHVCTELSTHAHEHVCVDIHTQKRKQRCMYTNMYICTYRHRQAGRQTDKQTDT